MSAQHQDLRLRMEMLRLRGELQRSDAEEALRNFSAASRGIHDLVSAVLRVGSASRTGAEQVAPLLSALRERPWLLGMAMFALRSARRHPVAALVAAAAALAVRFMLRAPPARPRDTDPLSD